MSLSGLLALEISNIIYLLNLLLFLRLNLYRFHIPSSHFKHSVSKSYVSIWTRLKYGIGQYPWFASSCILITFCSCVWHFCNYKTWCGAWTNTYDANTISLSDQVAMDFDMFGILFGLPSILPLLFSNILAFWQEMLIVMNVSLVTLFIVFIPGFVSSGIGAVLFIVLVIFPIHYRLFQFFRKYRHSSFRFVVVFWTLNCSIIVSLCLAAYFKIMQDDWYDQRHSLWHLFSGLVGTFLVLHVENIAIEQEMHKAVDI